MCRIHVQSICKICIKCGYQRRFTFENLQYTWQSFKISEPFKKIKIKTKKKGLAVAWWDSMPSLKI